MSYTLIIGIDPGVSGGIAFIKNGVVSTHKMPTQKININGKNRNETNIIGLQQLLDLATLDQEPIVFIEKVSPRPQDATQANNRQFQIAKMMANYEALRTVMKIFRIPMVEVAPRTWQKYLNLVKKGEEQRDRKNRYKAFASEVLKKPAVLWNADAVCLAQFGLLKVNREMDWIKQQLEK